MGCICYKGENLHAILLELLDNVSSSFVTFVLYVL